MVSNSSRSSRTRVWEGEDKGDDDNDDDDNDDDVTISIRLACKDDQILNDGTLLTEVLQVDTIDRLLDCGTYKYL